MEISIIQFIFTFIVIGITNLFFYRWGYSKGARRVLNEWRNWLNEREDR